MKTFYDVLELKAILEHVARYASTQEANQRILALVPSKIEEDIRISLEETNEAYKAIHAYGALDLGGLYSIRNSILRSQIGAVLSAEELLNISQSVTVSDTCTKYFKTLKTNLIPALRLSEHASGLVNLANVRSFIRNAISEDAKVLDTASKELHLVRRSISIAESKLRTKMNELLSSKANMLTEHLIVLRNNRMCLPVKAEYKNSFKGVILDESASHTTVYIEPEACYVIQVELENLKHREVKEVEAVLSSLSLVVGANADDLLNNLDILTHLDIVFAKAKYAKQEDHVLPLLNMDNHIVLKGARHPLIPRDKVVPIDLELSKTNSIMVITGPNTGGKTVAIKTVGLLTLMTSCGLFIPAKENSKIAVYDFIAADIGDEQSIEQSLSTFSSHMTKIAKILNDANENSLILLDELGSGTDPKEGSALAISIIDYLKAKGATVIATTHYSDLKNYAFSTKGVINASVEFNIETLMPTYRLLMGIPGKSNALDIASRLGIQEEIIKEARQVLVSNASNSQTLMNTLDEETQKMRNKEDEYHRIISEYNVMLTKVEAEKERLQKDTAKIIDRSKKEAQKIIEQAKEDAKEILDEIKSMQTSSYKEHELAYAKNKLNQLSPVENEEVMAYELAVGDYVLIKSYDTIGEIKAIKKDKYVVNMGQFAIEFKKSDLIKTHKPKMKRMKPKYHYTGENPAPSAPLSLDLRGKRYDEVNELVDSFIDQALLGNRKEISIIHGFGTGAVRNAVHAYLMQSSHIESYRFGKEGEGLNGVTIVYLK